MTSTNHALTGAFLAVSIKNPEVVLPLAVLSHFIVDMVPHWNHKVSKKNERPVNTAEFLLTSFLILALALTIDVSSWLLLGSIFLAIAPDLMWLPEIWRGKLPDMSGDSILHRLRRLHQKIQWSETNKGLWIEAGWFLLLIIIIFRFNSL